MDKGLTDIQKKLFEKLHHSGASELFAGFVMRYPDTFFAHDLLHGLPGGHTYKALWEGNFVKAAQLADLENHKRLITLVSEDDWRHNFCIVPAELKIRTEFEEEVVNVMSDRLSDDLHERYAENTSWGDSRDYTPTNEDIIKLLEKDVMEFVSLCKTLGYNNMEIAELTEEIKKESDRYLKYHKE